MISLLLAPAAHGKTAHALARIREVREREPLSPITIVLPNQIQLLAFRQRLAQSGGALGVSLFTVYGLYAELLARAGQPVPELHSEAQIRLLRAVINQLAERDALTYFAPLRDKPGFAVAVREAIEEFKRARLPAEELAPKIHGLGPRLEELVAIYSAYQSWLREKNWADPEGLGWLAALALEQAEALGRDMRLLVVDGFDEFNPTQLAVLAHLATRAHETLITLTGDPSRRRLAHRRFQRAEQNLLRVMRGLEPAAAGGEVTTSAELLFLEWNLFEAEPPAMLRAHSSRLTFLEAQTRAAEARAALRWLKHRVLEDGVPLNETALLARSLDPYRVFIEETAHEFGLPLQMVGGAPLADSPVVSALLAALALPLDSQAWRPRALLAAWRNPYFDWTALALTATHAATLDAVARLGRVVGGLEQWREALERLSTAPGDAVDDEPETNVPRPAPEAVTAARHAFESFIAHLTPPPRAPLRDYVAFVEDLIGDDPTLLTARFGSVGTTLAATRSLNVVARALAGPDTAPRDLAALRAFKEILRGLMLTEVFIREAQAEWDYASFVIALREAIEAAVYQTPTQTQTSDGIFVASVLDARGLSFRAVAVLGLAEGDFPLAEREMPFLRETDRAALRERGLPIEPRLRGDEVSIFYEAVTRAREHLLLCRPYLADDGQQWEPSAYWREAYRLMGEPTKITARPEDHLSSEEVASPVEWIEHGYDASAIARGLAVLRARLAPEANGPHEGDLSQLPMTNYPPSWSASRLEAYGTCGFYFYVAHTLKLEPRAEPEEGYDARALGNMYHVILEQLYRSAPNPNLLDELLTRLPEIARAVFENAPKTYGFRPTALWTQQQAELLRILRDTVTALADESEGWTPRYFEQRFGFGEKLLVVQTPEGDVRLHGYIDRVDVNAEGRLRVVDYKASGSPITAADLQDGHRLQLPLYALAARDALKLGEVAGGFYWHIGRAEPSSFKLEKFEGGVPGAFAAVKQHLAAHLAGIRAGQFRPEPPAGGCPSYCPAIAFCWRYKAKNF